MNNLPLEELNTLKRVRNELVNSGFDSALTIATRGSNTNVVSVGKLSIVEIMSTIGTLCEVAEANDSSDDNMTNLTSKEKLLATTINALEISPNEIVHVLNFLMERSD